VIYAGHVELLRQRELGGCDALDRRTRRQGIHAEIWRESFSGNVHVEDQEVDGKDDGYFHRRPRKISHGYRR